MSAAALLAKLDGVQGKGPRYRAICPAHTSKHHTRSLAVYEADDGRVLVKCHAGCSFEQIIGAAGVDIADLFPPRQDDHYKSPVRKPWSARDVTRALEYEAMIAWVVLADLAAGRPIGKSDRARAGVAADRCANLIRELSSGG